MARCFHLITDQRGGCSRWTALCMATALSTTIRGWKLTAIDLTSQEACPGTQARQWIDTKPYPRRWLVALSGEAVCLGASSSH